MSHGFSSAVRRGNVRASHPAAPGSNHGPTEIFSLLLSLWTLERSTPTSAYAREFAIAVSGKGLS